MTIKDFTLSASDSQIEELYQHLADVKNEMEKLNVIVSDMKTTNSCVEIKDGKIQKIIIFDGYGSPSFIPVDKYCPFFGRMKINRQWKKLWKSHAGDLELKRKLSEGVE